MVNGMQNCVELAPILTVPRKRCSSFPKLDTILEEYPKGFGVLKRRNLFVLPIILFSFISYVILFRQY